MSRRLLLVIAILLSAFTITSCSLQSTHDHGSMPKPDESSLNEASAAPEGGTYLTSALSNEVLGLKFFDQNGDEFTLGELKGKYIVIANFLTSCQEVCPMTTANMRVIADKVAAAGMADKIAVVEITVDPQRDTAERLAAYQALFGSTSWTLASSTEENLMILWDFFGVLPERMDYTKEQQAEFPKDWQTGEASTYDVMHSDLVMVIDSESNWRWLDLGHPATVDGKLPPKLRAYLNAEGIEHLEEPTPEDWTVKGVLAALSTLTGTEITL